MSALQVTWFLLIGVLLTGYAILDGFDLGVGSLYIFTKKDQHRRMLLNSVGPFWDGNEVWLLTGAGAIFAAFPHVYATVFSGFYLAMMLVLFALIFRAVSLEYRNKEDSSAWRKGWDLGFWLGSVLPALLLGVALGNILRGLPLDSQMNFTGNFFTLLNPYALLIGLVGLGMFVTHGALFLCLRTDGELAQLAKAWANRAWWFYLIILMVTHVITVITQPHLLSNYMAVPVLWLIPVLGIFAVVMIKVFLAKARLGLAFVFSSLAIAFHMATSGAGLFPNMVPGLNDPDLSITISSASSSSLTLTVMLVMALVGMPFVLGYTIWVYRTFAGKVEADSGY